MSDGYLTDPQTAASGGAGTDRDLYGLIRMAGHCVAIPAQAIREAVPCPGELDPFPATRPDLVGALELRGEVIPVIDLASLLGTSREDLASDACIVLILRQDNRVYGVVAEAIVGVTTLDGMAISSLERRAPHDEAPLFHHSFNTGTHNGVVLDPAAVASLPGMPLAQDGIVRAHGVRRVEEPTLIFSVNGLRLALSAAEVDASLPWHDMHPAPAPDPLWIGLRDYKGGQIPVIDTLALLGHGAFPASRRGGSSIVVRTRLPEGGDHGDRPHGLVALLIDTVDTIDRFPPDRCNPLLQGGVAGAMLAKGLLDSPAGPCLLLDAQRLSSHPALVMLGVLENRDDASSGGTAGVAGGARTAAGHVDQPGRDAMPAQSADRLRPFLVFSLGDQRFSAPLETVEEILEDNQSLVPLPDGGAGLLGLFSARGQGVPLIDLARCMGVPGTDQGRFVIVTRCDRGDVIRRTAFRVDALHSVDRKPVQRLAGRAARPDQRALGLPEATIRLHDGHACTVLDLLAIGDRAVDQACLAA